MQHKIAAFICKCDFSVNPWIHYWKCIEQVCPELKHNELPESLSPAVSSICLACRLLEAPVSSRTITCLGAQIHLQREECSAQAGNPRPLPSLEQVQHGSFGARLLGVTQELKQITWGMTSLSLNSYTRSVHASVFLLQGKHVPDPHSCSRWLSFCLWTVFEGCTTNPQDSAFKQGTKLIRKQN